MLSPNTTAASLKPLLEECGYTGSRLERDYNLGRITIPLVGFSTRERDMDAACIAVVDGGGDPEAAVRSCYELAVPIIWVRHNGSVDWWIQRRNNPELFATRSVAKFPTFVNKYKDALNPISIYRSRTIARIDPSRQLDFVDMGLLPLLRKDAGKKLHDVVEAMTKATLKAMRQTNPSKETLRDVFTSVFRMLAGKILKDKRISSFSSLDLTKPRVVLEAVAAHYDSLHPKPTPPTSGYKVLQHAATILAESGNFAVVSPESLAYVYETTLVTKELRKKLGIHATPPWLVDYMVWQLYDWIREIPAADRHVFEPACGHAPFLLAMMRLLRMEMEGSTDRNIHRYLKNHIHGIEIDDFAREIARLSLTLADIPNPDGWDLRDGDMYASDVLMREAKRCRILLSNPPYEKFKPSEKAHCTHMGFPTKHKKAVELVGRTLTHLPAGAIFGLIVPQTIISGPEAKYIREFLLKECELAEICRFPGKVFKFAQIETAIILGRRKFPERSVGPHHVRIRTVGERGMQAFQYNYAVDEDATANQAQLLAHSAMELKIPALAQVWKFLEHNPRLRTIADVGRGIEYKGESVRNSQPVVIDVQRPGFQQGYAGVSRTQAVFRLPPTRWLSLDQALIGNARQGLPTYRPQVLVNMGRASRFRWRIKPLMDPLGLAVKNNFAIIRPRQVEDGTMCLYLWSILISPIANAFAASRTMRKHNYEGILREIPLPPENKHMYHNVIVAAEAYRNMAAKRESEMDQYRTAAGESLYTPPAPNLTVTPETDVRDTLLKLDAAVIRAYGLPVKLERQLLDYFNGNLRGGVGCEFGDYYPSEFKSLVPLSIFISDAYRNSAIDAVAKRMKPGESASVASALRDADRAFGEED